MERPTFDQLEQIIASQADKPQWKDQPVADIVGYIGTEVEELKQAIESDEGRMHIASELADVLYLTLRLSNALGIDPLKALQMKTVRNALKYPMGREGDYSEYSAKAKDEWKMIGDDTFFGWWVDAEGEP